MARTMMATMMAALKGVPLNNSEQKASFTNIKTLGLMRTRKKFQKKGHGSSIRGEMKQLQSSSDLHNGKTLYYYRLNFAKNVSTETMVLFNSLLVACSRFLIRTSMPPFFFST